jgi:hypothetical protein
MRKSIIISAVVTVVFGISVSAQNNYQFDNFSFENGVRVHLPPPPSVARSTDKAGRKLTLSKNFKYSPPEGSLIHLASQSVNPSMGGFTTGNSDVDRFIVDAGKRNSVDPLLLYSIMHQESSFKPRAVSYKGARGLMQLMPPTAVRFGVSNIWDAKQNIEGGARYMRFLLDLFSGDVNLALAGYNAGEGAVIKYGYNIPPYSETQEYVRRIGRRYSLIRDPLAAAHASNLTSAQVAEVQQRDPKPLNVYERSVFMARLPDGRLQLVSQ